MTASKGAPLGVITFLDTETNKFWIDNRRPEDSLQAIPIQIAALHDRDGQIVAAESAFLARTGWANRKIIEVEERCVEKHGITEAMLDLDGQPPMLVAIHLRRQLERARLVVGHNIPFDVQVIDAFFAAMDLPPLAWPETFCTMRESTDIIRIPKANGRGNKWPKLGEAFFHFAKRPLVGAHNALVDIMATRVVYKGILRHRAAESASKEEASPPAMAPASE